MNQTQLYTVISVMAIFHNNQRYEQGDTIALTEEEAARISLYVQLNEAETARQQAEAEAEKARLAAEEKARKAAEKASKAEKEKEQNKGEPQGEQ